MYLENNYYRWDLITELIKKNNYVLQSGDIIFVAEKIEYNDEWFLFKEYLTSISQIAVLFYYIQFIYIRLP